MTMSISLCMIHLEVYLIVNLNQGHRIRNEQVVAKIRKLVKIGKAKQGVLVHP